MCASLLLVMGAASGCASQTTGAATAPPNAQSILQRVAQASYRDVTFSYTETVHTDSALDPATGAVLVKGGDVTTTGAGALTMAPRRLQYKQQTPRTLPCGTNADMLSTETVRDDANRAVYFRTGQHLDSRTCQVVDVLTAWQKGQYVYPQVSDVDPTGLSRIPAEDLAALKYVGDEVVDGASVYHLRVERSYMGDGLVGTPAAVTVSTDIYINRETAHPTRIVRRISQGDAFTMNFSAYDTGVAIDLPSVG